MNHAHTMRPYISNLPESEKVWWCRCGFKRTYPLDEQFATGWTGRPARTAKEVRAAAKSLAEQGSYIYVAESAVWEPK
jgi:hypothetical protein